MNSLEQRRYCGLMQNYIQNKFGVFPSATDKGSCLFIKKPDIEKVKGLPYKWAGRGVYIIDVNKTNLKKIGLM